MSQQNSSQQKLLLQQRARAMRHEPTPSESLLWDALRGGRLGVRFVRQVPIERFIVDFLAPSRRLIVEVDGDIYHQQRSTADAARDRKLVRAGYTVLRLPASLVERRLAVAVARIAMAL